MTRPRRKPALESETQSIIVPTEGSGLAHDYIQTTKKLAVERLKRLKHQNKKLVLDLAEKQGAVVSANELRREVLAANATVRQQMLALSFTLAEPLAAVSDPREVARILHTAITEALNDLAYERERAVA